MCGRYVHPDQAAVERAWHIGRHNQNPFAARFNVSPTMLIPILRRTPDGDALELTTARWSFVPHWWKQPKPPSATINARSEEAAIKPMWRDAYKSGKAHILMPALAYYEWQERQHADPQTGEIKSYKQPYCFFRPNREPFCFAGLASWWRVPDKPEPILTCALLTRAASAAVAPVHDRMPVVLPEELFSAWTDPGLTTASATKLLLDRALDEFSWMPVRTLVNNARSEGPQLMEPAPS
ncbi:MAG: SOS response-associated peptidase [Burkholderiales bacterium]